MVTNQIISVAEYKQMINSKAEKKTRRQHEFKLQTSIVAYVNHFYGDKVWIKGSDYTSKSLQEGAKKKALGYTKGMPDLELVDKTKALPTLYIELKTAEDKQNNIKAGRESKDQKTLRESMIAVGYKWVVVDTLEKALEEIRDYFKL